MVKNKTWRLCNHCLSAYKTSNDYGECPYCEASTFMDGFLWSKLSATYPHLPKEPEEGVKYNIFISIDYTK